MPKSNEKPKYVKELTCPECGTDDAVGLTSDTNFDEFKIGWCECGFTWIDAFGHTEQIKEWQTI